MLNIKERKRLFTISKTLISSTNYVKQPIIAVLPKNVAILQAYTKVITPDLDIDSKYVIFAQTNETLIANPETIILQSQRVYDSLGIFLFDSVPSILPRNKEVYWVRFAHSNGSSSAELEIYLTLLEYDLSIGTYF